MSRREEIVLAATRLFSERGYDGASMEVLAKNVGLRKASLFHHFPSKDALYAEVVGGLLKDVGHVIASASTPEAPYLERLNSVNDALVDLFGGRPHAARLLFREAMDHGPVMEAWLGEAIKNVLALAQAFAEEGQRAGYFRDLDPKQFVVSLIGVFLTPFVVGDVVGAFTGAPMDSAEALYARKKAIRAQLFRWAGAP